MEALEEALQQLVGVVDPLGILANNPDHGSAGVGLIQRVQILTQCGDDAFIPEEHQCLNGEKETLHAAYSFNVQCILSAAGIQRSASPVKCCKCDC